MSWRRPKTLNCCQRPRSNHKAESQGGDTQDIAETHWKSFYNNWKYLWSLPNKLPWTTFPISHCSRRRPPVLRSSHYGSWPYSGYPVSMDLKGIPYRHKHSLPNSETVFKNKTQLRSARYASFSSTTAKCGAILTWTTVWPRVWLKSVISYLGKVKVAFNCQWMM